MENKKKKYKEIFKNFKKINAPLPVIQIKINQQNKDIEKVLCEMDKNYSMVNPNLKKIQKSENKTRNKIPLSILKDSKTKEKIDFGPVTYLTYKENIDDDIDLRKYNYELLREKIVNSKNFRIGFLNKNFDNIKNTIKNKKINRSEKKITNNINRKRLSINPPYIDNKIKNDKIETEIRTHSSNFNDKENPKEIKSIFNFTNEINNFLDTQSNTNTDINNMKTLIKETRHISPFTESNKVNNLSNINVNDNFFFDNNTTRNSYLSNKNTSLTNRTNMTNYTNLNTNFKSNINKYTITNYFDKKRPIDLKETTIKNKNNTGSNFMDYKDLLQYYRTNNNFLNITNNKIKNKIQLKPFSMINDKILSIDGVAQLQEKKLNRISKKKKQNLKFIEKLIKKNIFSSSIIQLLTNGKKHKVKLRANINEIKRQMDHLSLVDKIEKYSDSIPTEKLETFNEHYNLKSERIGITNKCITLKNGKIYHQSKSDSKKLSQKIEQNCEEINKLAEQIMIDKYYFWEKDSKCRRLFEKIKKEKIDLSININ